MNPFGYFDVLGRAGGVTALLLIAALVLAIVLFVKFGTRKADHGNSLTRFFSFDHLFIESIMKFLYVLSVTTITAICIAIPIGMLIVVNSYSYASGFGIPAFFSALISAIVLFFLLQFLNRMIFEWSMLFIRGAVDIHDIRNKMLGKTDPEYDDSSFDKVSAAAGAGFAAAKSAFSKANESWQASKTTGYAPQAGHPAQPMQPTQPVAGNGTTWDCPCGRRGNKGAFCGQCGRPRP